jgi:hypothetical protein
LDLGILIFTGEFILDRTVDDTTFINPEAITAIDHGIGRE